MRRRCACGRPRGVRAVLRRRAVPTRHPCSAQAPRCSDPGEMGAPRGAKSVVGGPRSLARLLAAASSSWFVPQVATWAGRALARRGLPPALFACRAGPAGGGRVCLAVVRCGGPARWCARGPSGGVAACLFAGVLIEEMGRCIDLLGFDCAACRQLPRGGPQAHGVVEGVARGRGRVGWASSRPGAARSVGSMQASPTASGQCVFQSSVLWPFAERASRAARTSFARERLCMEGPSGLICDPPGGSALGRLHTWRLIRFLCRSGPTSPAKVARTKKHMA